MQFIVKGSILPASMFSIYVEIQVRYMLDIISVSDIRLVIVLTLQKCITFTPNYRNHILNIESTLSIDIELSGQLRRVIPCSRNKVVK